MLMVLTNNTMSNTNTDNDTNDEAYDDNECNMTGNDADDNDASDNVTRASPSEEKHKKQKTYANNGNYQKGKITTGFRQNGKEATN